MATPKDIKKIIFEIKTTFGKISVFESFLKTCLMFLGIYFFLMLFNLFPIFAVIPALLYFFYEIRKLSKQLTINTIEEKYPALNEELRTAKDTMELEENAMLSYLRKDVVKKMKSVKVSTFFNVPVILSFFVAVIGMSFLVTYASSHNWVLIDLGGMIQGGDELIVGAVSLLDEITKDDDKPAFIGTQQLAENKHDPNAIYGDDRIAQLGDESLDLEIDLVREKVNVRDVSQVRKKEFESNQESEAIKAISDASFQDNIPKDQQDLVRNYFNSLAQSSGAQGK